MLATHYQESLKTQWLVVVKDITTFSFHAIKNVTAGEGGAAMTNNSDISKKIKFVKNSWYNKRKKSFQKTLKSYQPIMNKFYLIQFQTYRFSGCFSQKPIKKIKKNFY